MEEAKATDDGKVTIGWRVKYRTISGQWFYVNANRHVGEARPAPTTLVDAADRYEALPPMSKKAAHIVKVTKRKAVSVEGELERGGCSGCYLRIAADLAGAGFKGGDRVRLTRLSSVRP